MSAYRSYAQPITNTYAVNAAGTTNFYSLSNLTSKLLLQAGVTQVGDVFVAPTISAVTTAFAAATPLSSPAANSTLTDLGKTVTIVVGSDAKLKLRKVSYQTAATTIVTGYVVTENTYNAGMASANLLKVGVYRA